MAKGPDGARRDVTGRFSLHHKPNTNPFSSEPKPPAGKRPHAGAHKANTKCVSRCLRCYSSPVPTRAPELQFGATKEGSAGRTQTTHRGRGGAHHTHVSWPGGGSGSCSCSAARSFASLRRLHRATEAASLSLSVWVSRQMPLCTTRSIVV